MMNLRLLVLAVFIVIFSCCKREKPLVDAVNVDLENQILVLNEGNFNAGNASIDLYNRLQNTVQSNVFETNNQRPLGDILQSAKIINGQLWLVLNNSGKIEVVDTSNFKSVLVISGLRSPRYIYEFNGKAYVSDLYAEKITVIDVASYTIEGSIAESGWVEQIEGMGNILYFINLDSNYVKQYDITSKSFAKVDILAKPFDLVKTNQGIFAAYFANDSLILYNLTSNTKVIYPQVLSNVPSKMVYSESTSTWFLKQGNDIMKLTTSNQLQKMYSLTSGSLYAMDIIGSDIYLSNAKDYVQKSELIVINLEGVEMAKRTVGRISNGFLQLK